ncbi:Solitary outer membrane autotransporter beta-barrel domain [Shewanella gelidimarina]|uniref:Solitary outer membrane autotransporter beta-barrel domain n=1 Tax=Shewanella gelidimarina TaxID=56813 RepID=UPI00200E9C48|nr:Solitary outer membrane autotransporter beta-barrel domain [Shewanella gelidimarina]
MARENIATSIVLTDASLITLGVVNFDPSSVVDVGGLDTGSQSSLQRRRELKTYSLPWNGDWTQAFPHWHTSTYFKLSYIGSNQTVDFSQPLIDIDELSEKSYLFQAEQRWQYALTDHWKTQIGIGAQAIWYENQFQYRSELKELESLFDNGLLNTSYGALVIDPSIEFRYDNLFFGHRWQFISRYRFAIGRTVLTDTAPQEVFSKVGRFSNTFMFHYDLPLLADNDNELRLMFQRIDLSGDAVQPLGTDHFYKVGAGWVIDTPWLLSWIDNVGLGVTVNIGSVLSGGSILLLFNEDI